MKRQPTQQELEVQLHSYFAGSARLSAPPSLTGLLDRLPDRPATRRHWSAGKLRLAAIALAIIALLALVLLPLLLWTLQNNAGSIQSPTAPASASPSPSGAGEAAIFIAYTHSLRAGQTGILTVASPDTLDCTVLVYAGSQTFQNTTGFGIPAGTAQSVPYRVAASFSGTAYLKLTCAYADQPGRASETWDLPFTVIALPSWSMQVTANDTRAAKGYTIGYTASRAASCTLVLTFPADAYTGQPAVSTIDFEAQEGVAGVLSGSIPGSPNAGTATWQTTCADSADEIHVDTGTFRILPSVAPKPTDTPYVPSG
jgi:hypothetical protein